MSCHREERVPFASDVAISTTIDSVTVIARRVFCAEAIPKVDQCGDCASRLREADAQRQGISQRQVPWLVVSSVPTGWQSPTTQVGTASALEGLAVTKQRHREPCPEATREPESVST